MCGVEGGLVVHISMLLPEGFVTSDQHQAATLAAPALAAVRLVALGHQVEDHDVPSPWLVPVGGVGEAGGSVSGINVNFSPS